MERRSYDVVVVGAGPAGENVAARVAEGGLRVAVVESELVGGECSYWACMPSKALLRSAEAVAAARRLAGAAEAVTGELDVGAVLSRRDAIAGHWDDAGQVRWLEGAGVDLVRGRGRLAGNKRVEAVADDGAVTTLGARHAVVVATGTRAAVPAVPGLAEARPWTSREATAAKEAPRRLAVIGGGVVAVEMATAWRALGTEEVTVLVRGERLLASFEPFVGERVAAALRERGVDLRTGTVVAEVRRAGGDGPVELRTDGGAALVADEVLVATGRLPNTDALGLETVGLGPGDWIDVDDTLRVGDVDGGWLYAVGDVNHRALLTHRGKYQARAAGEAIVARARGAAVAPVPWRPPVATADHAAVPQVVFADPEVASVGLTEAQARAAGLPVRAVEYDLGRVAGAALSADGYAGHAKMVVDEARRVVVGATLVGPGVGELVHAATVAVVGEVPLERLWHAVPAFPTMSEVWLRLLEEYGR